VSTTHPVRPESSPAAAPAAELGRWSPGSEAPRTGEAALAEALRDLGTPFWVVRGPDGPAVARGGSLAPSEDAPADALPAVAFAPPCRPEMLGDAGFRADHGLRYAYMTGAMANGIGSADIVEATARAGLLGSFGAAGLPLTVVETALDRLQASVTGLPHAFNLIHSPSEPALEDAVAALFARRGVRTVEASAFLDLTLPLVRYRLDGIHRDPEGRVVTPNRVIGKVSRVEVATRFLSPAPAAMLDELVRRGDLTREQAELATRVPVAQDLTAEADSGGHTDNRPLVALLPTLLALRDRIAAEHDYDVSLRVGAAGGIATPDSVAAAFAMGAAYVVTGSVNQSCVEAGTSDAVRSMLADAQQADVIMAPAADMFEMGVQVQVLKRGTMFAMRAAKLHELYRSRSGLDDLTDAERAQLERQHFKKDLATVWDETVAFFRERDPRQLERAETDPKHKMALVFRWYLGQSSYWANAGVPDRRIDYQVWCGPAMGAFNEWVKGTMLEPPEARRVATVARNLLAGAALRTRAAALTAQGVRLARATSAWTPVSDADLDRMLP
jgi:PfaD family protein